ncbi:MAG: histidinol-phosphatase [Bacteroides sp.]
MNLTNYHSHSTYCDGRAPIEDFVKEAIAQGFTSYGVSSHAPLPFSTRWSMDWEQMPAYLEEINLLKQKYAGQIELYAGLEIDYLNEESNPGAACFRDLPLDYRIGSVHLIYSKKGELVDVDVSAERFKTLVDTYFEGDLRRVVTLYYERLLRMMALGGFDILGHADKIHYNANCYQPGLLDEPWYDDLVRYYFTKIACSGYMMEINTKALYMLGTFFPNDRYFPLFYELGIPVQVNSDAHFPDKINNGRREALTALWQAGYKEVMELHGGAWIAVPITV